ncbi:hypothetical protein HK104_003373 [Borealophlyctis nickersoniae]|nr:hypothetical protein HK104_003373 [Borealophlyctis nickersoniae]
MAAVPAACAYLRTVIGAGITLTGGAPLAATGTCCGSGGITCGAAGTVTGIQGWEQRGMRDGKEGGKDPDRLTTNFHLRRPRGNVGTTRKAEQNGGAWTAPYVATGSLPAAFFTNLPDLTSFSIRGQPGITGALPSSLGTATQLGALDISGSGIRQIDPAVVQNAGITTCNGAAPQCLTTAAPAGLCAGFATLPVCGASSTLTRGPTGQAGTALPQPTNLPAAIPGDDVRSSASLYIFGATTTTSPTPVWTGLPQNSFKVDGSSPVAGYVVAGVAAAAAIVILSLLLVSCRQSSGRLSRKATLQRSLSRRGHGDDVALNPALLAPGIRDHSLAPNRTANNEDALANAKEFIAANRGKDEFPVVRAHAKTQPDELSLVAGDKVVLTRAFADGWAEGVSRRAGGPAMFPIACLGGSVPGILVRRYEQQQAALHQQQRGYGGHGMPGVGVHQQGGMYPPPQRGYDDRHYQ